MPTNSDPSTLDVPPPDIGIPALPPDFLPEPGIRQTKQMVSEYSIIRMAGVCNAHRDRLQYLIETAPEDFAPVDAVSLSMCLWFLSSMPIESAEQGELVLTLDGYAAVQWGDYHNDYIGITFSPQGTIHCGLKQRQRKLVKPRGFAHYQQVFDYIADNELTYLL